MPENRFYIDQFFEKGSAVQIEGEELRHLQVMRREIGDSVELVNGQNQLAQGQISAIDKKKALLQLTEVTTRAPGRQLILAQALLKPKNLDLVIEKGTELGATAFWLFPGQRSEKRDLSPTQTKRLRHLAISALKQCGRLDLPEIRLLPPLAQWDKFPQGERFFGDPDSKIAYTPSQSDTILFIGPEKGFSEKEEKILSTEALGVRIHSNVLRAETAALCFLSLRGCM